MLTKGDFSSKQEDLGRKNMDLRWFDFDQS
jgi:hypothetical protein